MQNRLDNGIAGLVLLVAALGSSQSSFQSAFVPEKALSGRSQCLQLLRIRHVLLTFLVLTFPRKPVCLNCGGVLQAISSQMQNTGMAQDPKNQNKGRAQDPEKQNKDRGHDPEMLKRMTTPVHHRQQHQCSQDAPSKGVKHCTEILAKLSLQSCHLQHPFPCDPLAALHLPLRPCKPCGLGRGFLGGFAPMSRCS
jgi:hypothetical protein